MLFPKKATSSVIVRFRRLFIAIAVIVFTVLPLAYGLAPYLFQTQSIPINVGEPLGVINFPTFLNVFPGEICAFPVTIRNVCDTTFHVTVVCTTDNLGYERAYVTFSNTTYTIVPGDNVISVSMTIDSRAPASTLGLAVNLFRT